MDQIFFSNWQSIIRTLVISVMAYAALVMILRISGKRTLSKMNAFDLIVTVALGSTLSSVIITKSVALADGVLAFVLLVLLQFIVTWFSVRYKKFGKLVKGSPTLMAYKGSLMEQNMIHERITADEVYAALRDRGISTLSDADAVILETDGTLSVLQRIAEPESPVIQTVRNAP